MDTFTKAYDESIRPLMDKIDQVRPLLSMDNAGIIFPNVVVVGDQSSGKTTLLESLSLVELPKGSGIVTRCPLVLRLRKSSKRTVYRVYDGNRKVILNEANLIMPRYIEEETRHLAGNNKNIVQDLIELQVEDPHVRDLTLVDLPGIARYPMGDQPGDIYTQTIKLIKKYISQEGSVILCVFPANVDIATVESLSLAREVDPSGKRTIGVITKSDLATDQETLVKQLLMNRHDVTRLKLGFVAVRNRSTDENISLEDARNREQEFFNQHPALLSVPQNCLGIDALINRLTVLYSDHVKETFPNIRHNIQIQLVEVDEQISKLPPDLRTTAARLTAYNELVDAYVEKILKVRLMGSNRGERISTINILHQKFVTFRKNIRKQRRELFSNEYRVKVQQELVKCSGEQLPNFHCSSMLKQFICDKLDQLWDATNKLINDCFLTTVYQLSQEEEDACKDNALLSKIIRIFHQVTCTYMNEKKEVVLSQLKELIELDQNDPYTINTSYMDFVEKYKGPLERNEPTTAPTSFCIADGTDDKEDDELLFAAISTDDQAVKQMLISIYSYWHLLIKRFIDYVTLSLRAGCVFAVCPNVRQRLRQIAIQRCDLIDKYLAEDDYIRDRRRKLQDLKERLEKAYTILQVDDNIAYDYRDTFGDFSTIETDLLVVLEAISGKLNKNNPSDITNDSVEPKNIVRPPVEHEQQLTTTPIKTFTTWNLQNTRIDTKATRHITHTLYNNTIITTLNLSNNGIRDRCGRMIVRALRYNKLSTLLTINLQHNRIGDAGAKHFTKILEQNTTLTNLDIGWNCITDKGAKDLANVLQRNRVNFICFDFIVTGTKSHGASILLRVWVWDGRE
ncbi:hypothetical protein I4U23_005058 [Adineta vaga]|nr:hypothetical protein I4U23_005058 [Adineta vaga]